MISIALPVLVLGFLGTLAIAAKGTAARAWKRLVSAATRQPPPDVSSVDLQLAMADYHDARRQQASLLRAAEPWISAAMV